MKIDCRQLDDFLNGELDEATQNEFRTHLASCSDCQEAYQVNEELDQLIVDAWDLIEAPKSIAPPKHDQQAHKRLSQRWRVLEICAAIALLTILVFSDSIKLRPFVANDDGDKEGLVFEGDELDTNQEITPPPKVDRQRVQFFESETNPSFVRTHEQTDEFTIVETHLMVQPIQSPNSD